MALPVVSREMIKNCDRNTLELLVLASLKHEEISEGRARELLGWKREKIREEQGKRVGMLDHRDGLRAGRDPFERGRNPQNLAETRRV